MSNLEYTDYSTVLSVKPNYCTLYRRNEQYIKGSRKMSENQLANIRGKKYSGAVTKKGMESMKLAVGWLISLAKKKRVFNVKYNSWFDFRVVFITLSLSSNQFNDDRVIKRDMLNSFLIKAKRKWGLQNYVWRAETQANGRLHFHILSDVFIPHDELKKEWNKIQLQHGYITETSQNKEPNSTDIHSLKTIGNVAAYVSKYCTKEDLSRRVVNGKIYGISDGLNRVKSCQVVLDETKANQLRNAIKNTNSGVVKKDYATIVYMPVVDLIKNTKFGYNEVVAYINDVYFQRDCLEDIELDIVENKVTYKPKVPDVVSQLKFNI